MCANCLCGCGSSLAGCLINENYKMIYIINIWNDNVIMSYFSDCAFLFFVKLVWMLEKNYYLCRRLSPDGGIGRRAGLKHQWIHFHAGSIPALGTKLELKR